MSVWGVVDLAADAVSPTDSFSAWSFLGSSFTFTYSTR